MKRFIRSILTIVVAGLLFAGSSFATDYDFSGQLPYHNSVQTFSFTANWSSNITLFTSSWDDGGFDPMLGLWKADGTYLDFQDDGLAEGSTSSNGVGYTYGVWDSYYSQLLDAGDYFVTISTYPNIPVGPSLSDGFDLDGQTGILIPAWVQPGTLNGYRTANYAFHLLGVDTAQNITNPAVPEPGTIVLLGVGLVGLAFARKRVKK